MADESYNTMREVYAEAIENAYNHAFENYEDESERNEFIE